MSDSLVFVFKTLISIPFIVFFLYLIFNMISLFVVYFNISGVAFTVQQIIMQNNGIPDVGDYCKNVTELMNSAVKQCDITALEMTAVANSTHETLTTITADGETNDGDYHTAASPKQFGDKILLHFSSRYEWLEPVRVGDVSDNAPGTALTHVGGYSDFKYGIEGSSAAGDGHAFVAPAAHTGLVYTASDDGKVDSQGINIDLYYLVPCMRYYPELGRASWDQHRIE